MVVENHVRKKLCKSLQFRQWLCRKPSAGLIWAASSRMQYAASTVRKAQAAAAVQHCAQSFLALKLLIIFNKINDIWSVILANQNIYHLPKNILSKLRFALDIVLTHMS